MNGNRFRGQMNTVSMAIKKAGKASLNASILAGKQACKGARTHSSNAWRASRSASRNSFEKISEAGNYAWNKSKENAEPLSAILKRARSYLQSQDFEDKLDKLLGKQFGLDEISAMNNSSKNRAERTQKKMKVLLQKYGKEVALSIGVGNEIGGFFGPDAAVNCSIVFGVTQVILIVGEVTYVFIIDTNTGEIVSA